MPDVKEQLKRISRGQEIQFFKTFKRTTGMLKGPVDLLGFKFLQFQD